MSERSTRCFLLTFCLLISFQNLSEAQDPPSNPNLVESTNRTPLYHAGTILRDRVLNTQPERTNYRYELALEAVLSFAEATNDENAVAKVFAIAQQLQITPETNVSWKAQPFGCFTWALYEASEDEAWLPVFRKQTDDLLQNVWRGPNGELLHPRGKTRGGGYAMLIDAMQQYVARMARMAAIVESEQSKYLEEIVLQGKIHRDVLRDPTTGLWCQGRGWLTETPEQLSPGAWSRGHGWLLQGFSQALEVLPEDSKARQVVLANFRELCASLLPLQQPDGSWHTLLQRDPTESPLDTSGTAMIATAMSKGVRLGWLHDPSYESAAQKAFALLPKYVTKDGQVLSTSPGPGPLQSEEDYLVEAFPPDNDHGIFAVLFAAAEQQRLLQYITTRKTAP